MSMYKVSSGLINHAGEFETISGAISQLAGEIEAINLAGAVGYAQLSDYQAQLDALRTKTAGCSDGVETLGSTMAQCAAKYQNAETDVCFRIEGGGVASGIARGITSISKYIESLNNAPVRVVKDGGLTKGKKKLLKNLIKKTLKELKKGSEKIVDIADIIEKIAKGDYLDAIKKAPGLFDVKSWNFKALKDVLPGSHDYSGIMNTAALKFETIVDTIKYVYSDKTMKMTQSYNDKMLECARKGDWGGVATNMISLWHHGVIGGASKIASSAISGMLDSYTKFMTGGIMDISLANTLLEETIGINPGKVVNELGKGVGAAADFFVDDLLPGAIDIVGKTGKVTESVIKAGVDVMDNVSQGINSVLKRLF